jgi:hypothetical protein
MVSYTILTSGTSTSNASTYDTASVTLTTGRLYDICVLNQDNAAPEQDPTGVATVGGAITFAKHAGGVAYPTFARKLSVWRIVAGSTVTAAVRITLPDAGVGCAWILVEYTGYDSTTPEGQTPVTGTATAASISATLAALNDTNSLQIAFAAVEADTADEVVSGTDWTETADVPTTGPTGRLAMAVNTSGVAQQVTFTGRTDERAIIMLEVAAPGVLSASLPTATVVTSAEALTPVGSGLQVVLPVATAAASLVSVSLLQTVPLPAVTAALSAVNLTLSGQVVDLPVADVAATAGGSLSITTDIAAVTAGIEALDLTPAFAGATSIPVASTAATALDLTPITERVATVPLVTAVSAAQAFTPALSGQSALLPIASVVINDASGQGVQSPNRTVIVRRRGRGNFNRW